MFKVAKDLDKLAIGVDSDQGAIYANSDNPEEKATADFILTSMLKRVDVAIFLTAKERIETGKNAGGYKSFGLKENGVGYAVNSFNEAKLAGVGSKVDEIRQMIVDGKIKVPDDDAKVADWAAQTF